jgi:hypothetical protein
VDLFKVLRAVHDFLAKHGHKLLKKDELGLLDGPPTESLERLRLAKAKREEFAYERELGLWRRVDEVQQGLAIFSNVIRQGIDNLQRRCGEEARGIMATALQDAISTFDQLGGSEEHDSVNTTQRSDDVGRLEAGDPTMPASAAADDA